MSLLKNTTKRKQKEFKDDEFATCLHEAAHAVIAHLFGFKVYKLNVAPEGKHGFTEMEIPVCPIMDTLMSLAGSAAESLWKGRPYGEISPEDYNDLRRRHISPGGMGSLYPTVRGLLRKNKSHVYRVAKELKKNRKLSRKQFLALVS